ncbi:MAG: hypothetical protein A2600_02830 [Candidatus Lambdaproteobacteria bacterium RIFOXYD1_FULL_56_27]|uniref:Haemolysin activator HlyB C-terminal domain-containing protein n=1 Tax=Candidatus Lambdaproteobacteria bacterium RIFOXYD2_FULL_56_26 TaxID=1817773 RepID=A0A1F6H347_9PROT|nr:MAG: hypothetical protein A2557_06895 [Candidatus Lambdaproteobacteria bacterium RIFOXYD2_FULL_56_26]OGH05332.1 MAG: hypothetical protein A2426_05220 [Candidatus Lambdaproteobacteria bacterium RIFOXYC1_FULL_56_13]OGH09174.1 MAG: hypothetical protein A2600_02830 [Candidatus Lambdaproteobacteria bacterium RIFOXYD1_FULL_56_27]
MPKSCWLVLAWLLAPAAPLLALGPEGPIEEVSLSEENFFDLLSYQYPAQWDREFHAHPSGLRATVGSLSQERFYQHQELVLDQPLGDQVGFGYRYLENSLYYSATPTQQAYFRFGQPWHLDLVGFPAAAKKDGDLGWAFGYGLRHRGFYFRASRLYENLLYNQKNRSPGLAEVTDQSVNNPVTDRLEVTWQGGGDWYLNGDWSHQATASHRWNQGALETRRSGTQYQGRVEWGTERVWGLRVLGERVFKEEWALSSRRQDLGYRWEELYTRWPVAPDWELTLGGQQGRFWDQVGADDPLSRFSSDLASRQVYGQALVTQKEGLQWLLALQGGRAELTQRYPFSRDDQDLRGVQLKASLGAVFFEADHWRLYLNSTWDLDLIIGRQWDGGNLQLMLFF